MYKYKMLYIRENNSNKIFFKKIIKKCHILSIYFVLYIRKIYILFTIVEIINFAVGFSKGSKLK